MKFSNFLFPASMTAADDGRIIDETLREAKLTEQLGFDTIWLAEAYPLWRKHGMEARSSTGVGALMGRETERLTIGWGIIAASTRHPVQAAMDARVVQEAAGPGRFILGFGTSKIFLNNTKTQTKKTLGPMRDAVAIARGVLSGERFEYDGDTWSADVPALAEGAHAPREVPPVYVAATAPNPAIARSADEDFLATLGYTLAPLTDFVALPMDAGGRVSCPFHNDPQPSCKVYSDHFYCYGCGERGELDRPGGCSRRAARSSLRGTASAHHDRRRHAALVASGAHRPDSRRWASGDSPERRF